MKMIFLLIAPLITLLFIGIGCTSTPPTVSHTGTQSQAPVVDTGSTDSQLVLPGRYADPDVLLLDDGTWRLYTGVEPEVAGTEFEVYTAVSDNGIDWELREEPVLTLATFPDAVLLPDGRIRLYYQSGTEIVSAVSEDGEVFTREVGTRIKQSGLLDKEGVAAPTVVSLSDGGYLMVYRASTVGSYRPQSINQTTTALITATSQDGISWTVGDILVDGRSEIFDGYVDGPELFFMGDELHLRFWSSGSYKDQAGTSGQYDMKSFDNGQVWSQPNMFSRILGGDPTYTVVDETLYMYYTVLTEGVYVFEEVL